MNIFNFYLNEKRVPYTIMSLINLSDEILDKVIYYQFFCNTQFWFDITINLITFWEWRVTRSFSNT